MREGFTVGCLIVIMLTLVVSASGQSSDQDLPTPVRANDINGTIPALDVGDPRLTRHFYAFSASHGDLLVTVESRNLGGDVDIFTAVNFKPLMKIPIYSQASSSLTTKSIYIRAEDVLILRVEARSASDENGLYRIRFGGTFAPFSGGIPVAEEDETTEAEKSASSSTRRGTRRVSSVGARLEERPATMTPEPTPGPEEKKAEPEKSKQEIGKYERPKSRSTARKPSGTRNTKSSKSGKTEKEQAKASDEVPAPKPDVSAEGETKSEQTPLAPVEAEKPATAPQDGPIQTQPGARLIILENDGTRIDRPMSTIRRVTIDNGWIVVFLKNGKVERFAMSDVARMTIEP